MTSPAGPSDAGTPAVPKTVSAPQFAGVAGIAPGQGAASTGAGLHLAGMGTPHNSSLQGIIAAGTPEEVAATTQSHTGAFLAPMLNVKPRKTKRPKAKAA